MNMNQLPQVTLSITFVPLKGAPETRLIRMSLPGVYVDVGDQDTLIGYPRRSLEAIVCPTPDNRVELEAFLDSMDLHQRFGGTFEIDLSHASSSYGSAQIEVKTSSIRSLRNGLFLIHFQSAKPEPKRMRWFIRWFGALIPNKLWAFQPKPVAPYNYAFVASNAAGETSRAP